MLTPQELLEIVDTLQPQLDELNTWITSDIIRRLMTRLGRGEEFLLTGTDEWRLEVYKSAGGHLEDLQQEMQRFTKKTDAEVKAIFEDIGIRSWEDDNVFYVQQGLQSVEFAQSEYMIKLLTDTYQRTNGEIHNFTRTTAKASQQQLVKVLDTAHFKVMSGAQSYTQAVSEAVDELANSQAKVSYPTGHVDTLETAVLRAVRTGVAQASGNIAMQGMIERDWDLIRTSAHIGARYGDGGENPSNHFWWQGKLFSRTGKTQGYLLFTEATGYGAGEGLCGWNCRHSFGPGDPNHNPYADYDSEENKKVYDLSQKQRTMERAIRKSKTRILGYRTAIENCDNDHIRQTLQEKYDKVTEKLSRQNAVYNKFCDVNGVKRYSDRLRVAKWNRSEASKTVITARNINRFKKSVLSAKETSTGVVLNDVGTHLYTRSNFRGASAADITEALTKPIGLGKIRTDNSQQFIGEHCTAVVNVKTGKAITCWTTSSAKVEKLKGG